MSVEIRWLGGNCPVQAEGTFDGVEFYFRARGTGVTCDVGEWVWEGPTYEWPEAGWISEDMARAYIDHAYADWKRQESRGPRKRRNDCSQTMMEHLMWAGRLRTELGEAARTVIDWHMAQADDLNKRRTPEPTDDE